MTASRAGAEPVAGGGAGVAREPLPLRVFRYGIRDYASTVDAMRRHVEARHAGEPDQLWLLQHPPVFTFGQAGRAEHLLDAGDTPVHHTDRGGQITYHAPGQLIAYVLLDLRRAGLGVRRLVDGLEESVIRALAAAGIDAGRRPRAPGVYVDGRKIAALGLRVRKGISYHGLALNVDLDLAPFSRINPCGYRDLEVVSTAALGLRWTVDEAGNRVAASLGEVLGYQPATVAGGDPRC